MDDQRELIVELALGPGPHSFFGLVFMNRNKIQLINVQDWRDEQHKLNKIEVLILNRVK